MTPLEIVIRAAKEQYGTVPLDKSDRNAIEAFLNAPGNVTGAQLGLLGGILISEFLQVDVEQQWKDTEDALWNKIEVKFGQLNLDKPDDWGPDIVLEDIANALP